MGSVLPRSQSSGSAMVDLGIQTGMVKKVESSPTTSEVSQATATDAAGIKRRRRGRSPTILTGAAGVQEGATLGTPTLLG
jgi:hypothetical protein